MAFGRSDHWIVFQFVNKLRLFMLQLIQEDAAATDALRPSDAGFAPLPPAPAEAEPVEPAVADAPSIDAPGVDAEAPVVEAPAIEPPRVDAEAPVVEAPAIEPEEYPDEMSLEELAARGQVQPEHEIAEPAVPRARAAAPRVRRSPAEILEQIAPPGIFIRLSFNDHRFKAETATFLQSDLSLLDSPYSQKAFSKCFGRGALSWQEALTQVHDYAWKKYDLFRIHGKSDAIDSPQEPGVIAADIFTQLEPEIQRMPPPTKYSKK